MLSYDFSNGNASRYQQDNRDLDESDMRAMGYIDMTLGGPGGTLVPPHKVGSFKNPLEINGASLSTKNQA